MTLPLPDWGVPFLELAPYLPDWDVAPYLPRWAMYPPHWGRTPYMPDLAPHELALLTEFALAELGPTPAGWYVPGAPG